MLVPEVNMRTGNYGWCVPFWINAIGAIIIGWNISQRAEVFLARGKILRIISNWLKSIGKNSIVYLCFNEIVILLITKMLDVIGLNGIVAKIPILVLTMMVLFVFQKLICETSLKVIIGK